MRKTIYVAVVELLFDPQWVLKIRMPDLAGVLCGKCRDPHAVVVNELEPKFLRRRPGTKSTLPCCKSA